MKRRQVARPAPLPLGKETAHVACSLLPPPPPCRPGGVGPPASAGKPHSPRLVLPSTARSMMVGRVFLVLTGACQFGHGVGGFTSNFIHSQFMSATITATGY